MVMFRDRVSSVMISQRRRKSELQALVPTFRTHRLRIHGLGLGFAPRYRHSFQRLWPLQPSKDLVITQLSCGENSLLFLVNSGRVFALGENSYGQLGQGHVEALVDTPHMIEFFVLSSRAALGGENSLNPTEVIVPASAVTICQLSCGHTHAGMISTSGMLFMTGERSYGRLGLGLLSKDNGDTHSHSSGVCCIPTQVQVHVDTKVCPSSSDMGRLLEEHHQQQELEESSAASSSSSSSPEHHPHSEDAKRVLHRQTIRTPTNHSNSSELPPQAEEEFVELSFRYVSCGARHSLVVADDPSFGHQSSKSLLAKHQHMSKTNLVMTSSSSSMVLAMGDGGNGRLGTGSEQDAYVPSRVRFPDSSSTSVHITKVCAGDSHSGALTSAGEVYMWGDGKYGKTGCAKSTSDWSPRKLEIWNSNNNDDGEQPQLDYPPLSSFKAQPKLETIQDLECGAQHTLALTTQGQVYAWGLGQEGELGVSAPQDSSHAFTSATPILVSGPLRGLVMDQIAIGAHVSAALSTSGQVYCWGKRHQEFSSDNDDDTPANVPQFLPMDHYILDNGQEITHTEESPDSNHHTSGSISLYPTVCHLSCSSTSTIVMSVYNEPGSGNYGEPGSGNKALVGGIPTIDLRRKPHQSPPGGAVDQSSSGATSAETKPRPPPNLLPGKTIQLDLVAHRVLIPSQETYFRDLIAQHDSKFIAKEQGRGAEKTLAEIHDALHEQLRLYSTDTVSRNTTDQAQERAKDRHRRMKHKPRTGAHVVKGMDTWLQHRSSNNNSNHHHHHHQYSGCITFSKASRFQKSNHHNPSREELDDVENVLPTKPTGRQFSFGPKSKTQSRARVIVETPGPSDYHCPKSTSSFSSPTSVVYKPRVGLLSRKLDTRAPVATAPKGGKISNHRKASRWHRIVLPSAALHNVRKNEKSAQFIQHGDFSHIIAKRLAAARGPGPGPGSYF